MLSHVEVRNALGDLLDLQLTDPSSGFLIEEFGGLGPVKATIVSSSFAAMDGTQYQSSRRENRNITLQLALVPDYISSSVRNLRQQLYNFFMPKSEVNLKFYLIDGLVVEINGRVESCEPVLFTKEPKINISILCFDPDFLDINEVILSGTTVTDSTETLISYDGTIETGIVFTMTLNHAASSFTIYHRTPDGSIRTLDFAASLLTGDVLMISTVSGDKAVILTRSGVSSSFLYGMSAQSNWIELQPGDNYIRVYCTASGAPIPYAIAYTPRHGGL